MATKKHLNTTNARVPEQLKQMIDLQKEKSAHFVENILRKIIGNLF